MASPTRRDFITSAALLIAAGIIPAGAAARTARIPPGLQLWTVKEELARDFEGTLRALGRMGYRRVEAAGWFDRSPRQIRAALKSAGLDCVAAHHNLADLIKDTDARLAFARDVGVRYIVASSPAPSRPLQPGKDWSHAVAEAMTLDDWRSNAEAMERIGRRARQMGLRFGYHNHSAEFLNYGGRLPMDEITRLTDPANVVLELDIGWVAGAGYDPVETIARYAPRIHLLHIKDLVTTERVPGKIVADERTVPIGQGSVDWPAVFRAVRRAPIHSWFVEIEAPFARPPLESLEQSLAYLRRISVA
jgi:sugar phosphate isomerase/epimerase